MIEIRAIELFIERASKMMLVENKIDRDIAAVVVYNGEASGMFLAS